jgi:hypothetical protein
MLPDSVVSTLQTCETAALAAAWVIAGSFPEVQSFAAGSALGDPLLNVRAAAIGATGERRPTNATNDWRPQ